MLEHNYNQVQLRVFGCFPIYLAQQTIWSLNYLIASASLQIDNAKSFVYI